MPNTQIDSLSINVEASSTKAADGISKLISSLSSLKKAVNGIGDLGKKLQNVTAAVDGISDNSITRFQNLATALGSVGSVKISPSVAKNITNIGKALDTITDSQIGKVNQLSDALSNMPKGTVKIQNPTSGGSGSGLPSPTNGAETPQVQNVAPESKSINGAADSIKVATDRTNDFKTAMDNIKSSGTKVKGVFSSIGSYFEKMSSPFTGFIDKVKSIAGGFMSGPVNGIRNLKNEIFGLGVESSASSTKLGQLLTSIGRIAMYRMLRTIIKEISEGLQEGIHNLYQYSAVVNNPFLKSMDKLATSFTYLKNSVAAAVAPLINAFAPAIDVVVDKVVSLINAFGKLTAAFTGKGYYTRAKKVQTSFAEIADTADDSQKKIKKTTQKAVDDTKKKKKEIQKTVLGFDELYMLNPQDKKKKDEDKKTSDPTDAVKNAVKKTTPNYGSMFEDVPIEQPIKDLAKKIKLDVQRGDWKDLGTTIGTKINDAMDKVDWKGIGDKLGRGLNGAIQTLYYTLKTIDFNKLGRDIADLLNHAIAQIDWNIAGRLLTRGFTSILDFLIGFIEKFDWGQLARAISNFVKGAFDEATEWLNSYDWSKLGTDMYKHIKDFITNLDVSGMADSIFRFLGTAIRSACEFLKGFFEPLWADVVKAWEDHVAKHDYGNFAANFFTAVSDAMGDIKDWSFNHILTPFMEGLIGKEKWDSVKNSVKKALDDIEAVVRGGLFGVGAILTLSGTNVPLGIALMVTSGLGSVGYVIEDWTKTGGNIHKCLADIEEMVGGATLVMGAVLTFSSADIPLGIALMAVGATAIAAGGALNWTMLSDQVRQVITSITTIVSTGMLALGAILAFSTVNIPLGIALMAAGAAILATSIAADWDSTTNHVQTVITAITSIVSMAVLALGVLLVFTGANIPLGFGLVVAGAVGLGASLGIDWDVMPNNITATLTKIAAIAGGSLLALGLILTLTNANPMLGVGLMVAGAAALATSIALDWNEITGEIQNWFSGIASVLVGTALVAIGLILTLTTANMPLGIGMIVAGGVSLATSIALNWGTIGTQLTNFFGKYGVLAGTAAIATGLILTIATGGAATPLGIGLIVAGIGSTIAGVALNWDTIGTQITGFFSKYGTLAGVGLTAMGVILTIATGGTTAPLGIAMVAAGIGSTIAQIALNWDTIGTQITGFFGKYGVLAGAGLITLGIILTVATGGVAAPLGIGMIVAGVASTIAQVAMDWDTIGGKIKAFFAKYGVLAGVGAIAIGTILLFTVAAAPIGIALILVGIGSTITGVTMDWGGVADKAQGGLGKVHDKFVEFKTNVTQTMGEVKKTVGNKWDEIKTHAVKAGENIRDKCSGAFETAKKNITGALDTIHSKTKTVWDNVKTKIHTVMDSVAQKISGKSSESSKAVETSTSSIKKSTDTNFGTSESNGLWRTAVNAFKGIASHIQKKMAEAGKNVTTSVANMKKAFTNASLGAQAGSAFDKVLTAITGRMEKAVTSVNRSVGEMKKALNGIDRATTHTIDQMQRRINSAISDMNSRVDSAVSSAESRLNSVGGSGGGGLFDFHLDFSNLFSGFASGGFPDEGEIFLARENNIPEMVGSIGGHTVVANNDDIVQAVSDGVESAVLSALSQTQNSNDSNPVFEVVVKTEDDEVLARAVTRGQEKLNYRLNPVG